MGTVDLRQFGDDQIVIHFGGSLTSIDAYTFANSLVAFADTVRAVNGAISSDDGIEVRVEALGPGSFRAVIKKISKGFFGKSLEEFFADGSRRLFWGLIAALIYDKAMRSDPSAKITINTNEVIMETGKDRVIVPRAVYDQMKALETSPEVQRNLSRTFEVIEADDAVENFGLTPKVDDPEPVVQIPRAIFPRLSTMTPVEGDGTKRRSQTDKARLLINKAWFTPGNRKWTFEWNGVPITAPIKDETFWSKLEKREYLIGQGDALDVEITYQQTYVEELGIWATDPHSYVVTRVIKTVPRSKQSGLNL
jgi:hypothetical protein